MLPGNNAFERIWNEEIDQARSDYLQYLTGYSERELVQAHVEVFYSLPDMINESRAERNDWWQGYLHNMVSDQASRDDRIDWLHDVGIDERDFDWQGWREAMGYGRGT